MKHLPRHPTAAKPLSSHGREADVEIFCPHGLASMASHSTETEDPNGLRAWDDSTGARRSLVEGDDARQREARLRDSAFEWHDASADLLTGAVDRWLTHFADQPFSLTDGVTFELMRRERISAAFAYDQPFPAVAGPDC